MVHSNYGFRFENKGSRIDPRINVGDSYSVDKEVKGQKKGIRKYDTSKLPKFIRPIAEFVLEKTVAFKTDQGLINKKSFYKFIDRNKTTETKGVDEIFQKQFSAFVRTTDAKLDNMLNAIDPGIIRKMITDKEGQIINENREKIDFVNAFDPKEAKNPDEFTTRNLYSGGHLVHVSKQPLKPFERLEKQAEKLEYLKHLSQQLKGEENLSGEVKKLKNDADLAFNKGLNAFKKGVDTLINEFITKLVRKDPPMNEVSSKGLYYELSKLELSHYKLIEGTAFQIEQPTLQAVLNAFGESDTKLNRLERDLKRLSSNQFSKEYRETSAAFREQAFKHMSICFAIIRQDPGIINEEIKHNMYNRILETASRIKNWE